MKTKGRRQSDNVKQAPKPTEAQERKMIMEEFWGPREADYDRRQRQNMATHRAIKFRNRHSPPNPIAKAAGVDSMDEAMERDKIKAKLKGKAKPKGPRNPFAKATGK